MRLSDRAGVCPPTVKSRAMTDEDGSVLSSFDPVDRGLAQHAAVVMMSDKLTTTGDKTCVLTHHFYKLLFTRGGDCEPRRARVARHRRAPIPRRASVDRFTRR